MLASPTLSSSLSDSVVLCRSLSPVTRRTSRLSTRLPCPDTIPPVPSPVPDTCPRSEELNAPPATSPAPRLPCTLLAQLPSGPRDRRIKAPGTTLALGARDGVDHAGEVPVPLGVPTAASGMAEAPGPLAVPWTLLPAECGCWLGSIRGRGTPRRRAEALVTGGGLLLLEAAGEMRPHPTGVSLPHDAAAAPAAAGRNGDVLESPLASIVVVCCSWSSTSSLHPNEPEPEPDRDTGPTRTLG